MTLKLFLITLIIAPILLCCESKFEAYQPSEAFHGQIKREIDSIKNANDLQFYLLKIQDLDQMPRQQENVVVENFGQDSEEYKIIWEKINRADIENKIRIRYLLEQFGYPDSDSVGQNAAEVPILVIHHSPEYNDRVEYFPIFYKAYKEGNIRSTLFSLYLDRMHMKKFNRYLEMKGPYKPDQKIDSLINLLDLKVQI